MHDLIEKQLWECLGMALTLKKNGEIKGIHYQLPGVLESAILRFYPTSETQHRLIELKRADIPITKSNSEEMPKSKVFKLTPDMFGVQSKQAQKPCCGGEESPEQVQAKSSTPPPAPTISEEEIAKLAPLDEEGLKAHFGNLSEIKKFANEKLGFDFKSQQRGSTVIPQVLVKIKSLAVTDEEE